MLEKNYTDVGIERASVDEGLRGYLLSVYHHMAGALAVTGLVAYLVANTSLINAFIDMQTGGMTGLGYLFLFLPLVMVFMFSGAVARSSLSTLRGIFWGYSAVMGVSLAPVFLVYTAESMTRVFLITSATFGAMSIYGTVTKRNLDSIGSFLIMGLWGIIIASIVNIFMRSSALAFALSVISVIVFTGLTAYDTQKIRQIYMEQDGEDTLTRKAIAGALTLYLDFINLFLNLLRLMGDRK